MSLKVVRGNFLRNNCGIRFPRLCYPRHWEKKGVVLVLSMGPQDEEASEEATEEIAAIENKIDMTPRNYGLN